MEVMCFALLQGLLCAHKHVHSKKTQKIRCPLQWSWVHMEFLPVGVFHSSVPGDTDRPGSKEQCTENWTESPETWVLHRTLL